MRERRWNLGLVLIWILVTPIVQAQTAPDISRGTLGEEVLRLYGWPRGKGTSDDREVWTYETFDVAFINNRVVGVSPHQPPKGVSPHRLRPIQRVEVPPPAVPQQPRSQPITPAPNPIPRRQPVSETPLIRPVLRSAPPVAINPFGMWMKFLVPFAIMFLGGIIGLIVLAERRRLAREVAERMRHTGTAAAKQTWQESMADQLKRATGSTPAPATSSAAAAPSELTYELLNQLEWKRIELLMALYFQATGIRAECTRIGADGGVDVHLFRNGEATPYAYIQCKAWVGDVGVKEVREFFGVMSAEKIGEGYFVTTGSFTADAIAFAKNRVVLIDGADLVKRINQLPPAPRARVLSEITTGDYHTPTCPSCDIKLVLRSSASGTFWSCTRFPRCRYKMPARKFVPD